MKGRKRRALVERLASLCTSSGMTLHAYVISTSASDEQIASALMSFADAEGWAYLPIVLSTTLDNVGGAVVREVLAEDPEATAVVERALSGAKEHATAIFAVATDSPADVKLMELH